MSIFRRRLMMQKAETSPYDKLGYIKEGKTFHLDGFNVGNVANRWVDMIRGNQWYSYEGKDLVFENGGLVSQRLISQTNVVGSNDFMTSTLEIVMELTNSGTDYSVRLGGASRLAFGKSGILSSYRGSSGGLFISTNTLIDRKFSMSIQDGSLLVDGGAFPASRRVGFKSTVNGIGEVGGHLYAVRLYNRLLTDEERLYNLSIDNERFNLGLEL